MAPIKAPQKKPKPYTEPTEGDGTCCFPIRTKAKHGLNDNMDMKLSSNEKKRSTCLMMRVGAVMGGIDLCYAAETALMVPILLKLGLPPYLVTLTWCVSPVLSFFLVPVIGSLSDICSLRLGRRRPFIVLLAVAVVIGLMLIAYGQLFGEFLGDYAYDPDIGVNMTTWPLSANQSEESPGPDTVSLGDHFRGIVMTLVGVVLLDFGCDASQAPCRAFMCDVSSQKDHQSGLATFTVLGGVGGTLGFLLAGVAWDFLPLADMLGASVQVVFIFVLIVFVSSGLVTVTSRRETPLAELDSDIALSSSNEEDRRSNSSEYRKDSTSFETDLVSRSMGSGKPSSYGSTKTALQKSSPGKDGGKRQQKETGRNLSDGQDPGKGSDTKEGKKRWRWGGKVKNKPAPLSENRSLDMSANIRRLADILSPGNSSNPFKDDNDDYGGLGEVVTSDSSDRAVLVGPSSNSKNKKPDRMAPSVEPGRDTEKVKYGKNPFESDDGELSEKSEEKMKATEKKTGNIVEKKGELVEKKVEIEMPHMSDPEAYNVTLKSYLNAIVNMPGFMWTLCVTSFFNNCAMISFLLFFTDFVGQIVYGGSPMSPPFSESRGKYDQGVRTGAMAMSLYASTCALYSLTLDGVLRRCGAKQVYIGGCLLLAVASVCMAALRTFWCVLAFPCAAAIFYATSLVLPFRLVALYHAEGMFSQQQQQQQQQQPRSIGADYSLVFSTMFVAQFVVAGGMGGLVTLAGSPMVVMAAIAAFSTLGGLWAAKIHYVG